MLIVCGSASSWILDNLINNHGGLYNRVTYEIHLLPFTLGECEDFLEDRNISLSRYDIAQCYMALGGIPYYLGYIRRNLSFAQNMDALFYHRDGKLKEEFDRLFESIFNNPQLMKSIVIALFAKNMGYTRSELLGKLKMKDGETFTKCLKALIASQFVEKYIPFGEKENCWHYRLADPFCQGSQRCRCCGTLESRQRRHCRSQSHLKGQHVILTFLYHLKDPEISGSFFISHQLKKQKSVL